MKDIEIKLVEVKSILGFSQTTIRNLLENNKIRRFDSDGRMFPDNYSSESIIEYLQNEIQELEEKKNLKTKQLEFAKSRFAEIDAARTEEFNNEVRKYALNHKPEKTMEWFGLPEPEFQEILANIE